MALTLKDIARILNVSPSTVSRVLSKNTGASEETKKRITELAKVLNYRPNPVAQSLVLKQTRFININHFTNGSILSDWISDHFMVWFRHDPV